MPLSEETKDKIRTGWLNGVPPIQLSKSLRLAPMTVIREYLHLDDLHQYRAEHEELYKNTGTVL